MKNCLVLSLFCALASACGAEVEEKPEAAATTEDTTATSPDSGTPIEEGLNDGSNDAGTEEVETPLVEETPLVDDTPVDVTPPARDFSITQELVISPDRTLTRGMTNGLYGAHIFVRTVTHGMNPVDLGAILREPTGNPYFGGMVNPYFMADTDPDDPRWEQWGGIAQGMSGSPVCILMDGEVWVIGSLSFSNGGRNNPPYSFIVTPIEEILSINGERPHGTPPPEWVPQQILMTTGSPYLDDIDWSELVPGATFPYDMPAVGSGTDPGPDFKLVAGSSISVTFITGPLLSSAGMGTATLVEGGTIYAFGHLFTGLGEVSFPYTPGFVFGINSEPGYGTFKNMSPVGAIRGTITTDELGGISGTEGMLPNVIPVHMTAEDGENPAVDMTHLVTRIPGAAYAEKSYMVASAIAPVDYMSGVITNPGTATYTITLTVNETAMVATRTGTIAGPDITSALYTVVRNALSELNNSGYWWMPAYDPYDAALTFTSLTFNTVIENRVQRTETITDLYAPEDAHPGETIIVAVTLYNPDGSHFDRAVRLTIPEDFPAGTARLTVASAPQLGPLPTLPTDPNADDAPRPPPLTPDERVAKFNAYEFRNDMLVVRLTAAQPPPTATDGGTPEPVLAPAVQVTSQETSTVAGHASREITIIRPTATDAGTPETDGGTVTDAGTEADAGTYPVTDGGTP